MPCVKEKRDRGIWAIDKDRNLSFRYRKATGGSSERIDIYELIYRDHYITFLARPESKGGSVHYKIIKLNMPEVLREAQDDTLKIIDEAFQAYGYYGVPKLITISVELEKNI